jgi:hypothetical protein
MFIQDAHNNIGRHCSIPLTHDSSGKARRWVLTRAMRTQRLGLAYLVRNIDDGRQLVLSHMRLSNLY